MARTRAQTYGLDLVAALDRASVTITVTGNGNCESNSGESKSEDGRETHVLEMLEDWVLLIQVWFSFTHFVLAFIPLLTCCLWRDISCLSHRFNSLILPSNKISHAFESQWVPYHFCMLENWQPKRCDPEAIVIADKFMNSNILCSIFRYHRLVSEFSVHAGGYVLGLSCVYYGELLSMQRYVWRLRSEFILVGWLLSCSPVIQDDAALPLVCHSLNSNQFYSGEKAAREFVSPRIKFPAHN